jgi:alpha-amylase
MARRAIGRAQCNDAYWHGVFGGLYLPHLRRAVWHQLAAAEAALRRGEPLGFEMLDLDGDGWDEIWVHAAAFSALLSPRRGGAIEEFTLFHPGINYADVLTRRREAYHEVAPAGSAALGPVNAAAPSIHEIEKGLRVERLPPVDPDRRALFVDRVLPRELTLEAYAGGEFAPLVSWADAAMTAAVHGGGETLEVECSAPGLEKRVRFEASGCLTVVYRWKSVDLPRGALFAPELSLAHPLELRCTPDAPVWSFPVATVSKSERGLDETVQGQSLTPRWDAALGEARVDIVV